jgi:hypothetical protein
VSSDHQNPTGQPVVGDVVGFEAIISTRRGRSGSVTFRLPLMA